jgi:hypothetical protein
MTSKTKTNAAQTRMLAWLRDRIPAAYVTGGEQPYIVFPDGEVHIFIDENYGDPQWVCRVSGYRWPLGSIEASESITVGALGWVLMEQVSTSPGDWFAPVAFALATISGDRSLAAAAMKQIARAYPYRGSEAEFDEEMSVL